jgi:hypothetical protein
MADERIALLSLLTNLDLFHICQVLISYVLSIIYLYRISIIKSNHKESFFDLLDIMKRNTFYTTKDQIIG